MRGLLDEPPYSYRREQRSLHGCSRLQSTLSLRPGEFQRTALRRTAARPLSPVRRGRTTFEQAVENSRVLFEAAAKAGVERIVHFSVASASVESSLPYFRDKGQVEEILKASEIPYASIRPTLVFGEGDLLLNNMAWALRRFPVFPVFGRGEYQVQPIYAENVAGRAVEASSLTENLVVAAVLGLRRNPADRSAAAGRGAQLRRG